MSAWSTAMKCEWCGASPIASCGLCTRCGRRLLYWESVSTAHPFDVQVARAPSGIYRVRRVHPHCFTAEVEHRNAPPIELGRADDMADAKEICVANRARV